MLWFGTSNVLIVLSTAVLDMAIFTATTEQDVEDLLRLTAGRSFLVATMSTVAIQLDITVLGGEFLIQGSFPWGSLALLMKIQRARSRIRYLDSSHLTFSIV
jgi:hypothetical protein